MWAISRLSNSDATRKRSRCGALISPRFLFYIVAATLVLGSTFAFGIRSATKQNMAFRFAHRLIDVVKITYEELPNLLGTYPKDFLQHSHHEGDGVTVNHLANRTEDLVLLSGFFDDTNELRLIRRNGGLVARWPVRFSYIFPEPDHLPQELVPATDWTYMAPSRCLMDRLSSTLNMAVLLNWTAVEMSSGRCLERHIIR